MQLRGGAGDKSAPEPETLAKDLSANLLAVLANLHEQFAGGRASLDQYAGTVERHARILRALSSSESGPDDPSSPGADLPGPDIPPFGSWEFHHDPSRVRAPTLRHLTAARRRFRVHSHPGGNRPPPVGEIVRASRQVTHSLLRDVEEQLRQGMVSPKTYLQMRSRLCLGRSRNGGGPEVEVALVAPVSAPSAG